VSVRTNSSDQDSPLLKYKSAGEIKREGGATAAVRVASRAATPLTRPRDKGKRAAYNLEMDPQVFYGAITKPPPQQLERRASTQKEVVKHERATALQRAPKGSRLGIDSKTGYDLLASSISSTGQTPLKPIYRRFEALHNRVLLYLQDEISELEEELKHIDRAIAEADREVGIRKTSRRAEMKLPSQLHWRRMEITRRIMATMDQYSEQRESAMPYNSLCA